jgi:hypothetical protein
VAVFLVIGAASLQRFMLSAFVTCGDKVPLQFAQLLRNLLLGVLLLLQAPPSTLWQGCG